MEPKNPPPYSLERLQELIARSSSYAELDQATKNKIQKYIELNDKPALIFVYNTLLQEEAENQISLEKLDQQILKSSQKQSQKATSFLSSLKKKQ